MGKIPNSGNASNQNFLSRTAIKKTKPENH